MTQVATLSKKEINEKIVSIISTNEPGKAAIQLLEWQAIIENSELLSKVREPILFILENQHDWQNIQKCLRYWKDVDKFEKGFYQRSKHRISEVPDKQINASDIKRQLPKIIDKLIAKNETEGIKKNHLVKGIQRYLIVSKKDPKPQKNIVEKQPVVTQKQQVVKHEDINMEEDSRTFLLDQRKNVRPILKRVTLEPSREGSVSRNSKRLSFGLGENLIKGIQKINEQVKKVEIVQTDIHKTNEEVKLQKKEQKIEKQQIVEINDKQQIQRSEVKESRKNNFLFQTQKKQNESKENQQRHLKSILRSITPNKPLVQRKKIIIKKLEPSDNYDFEGDSDFQSDRKNPQNFRQYDKNQMNKLKLVTKEQDELKKQIQKVVGEYSDPKDKSQISESIGQKPIKQIKQSLKVDKRQYQLYSDNELSFMNLSNKEPAITLPKIMAHLKRNSLGNFTQHMIKKIEKLQK